MIGPEKRDEVVAAYKFDPETRDAQDFATLLQSFNVILRLMSSWRREIKIEEFQHYVQNCHLKLHDMFEWLRDNGMDSLLNWIVEIWKFFIKFMFSKKATKIEEIFTIYLTLCSKCQIDGQMPACKNVKNYNFLDIHAF